MGRPRKQETARGRRNGTGSKDRLLKRVTEFYLSSGDFNGLPTGGLFSTDADRDRLRTDLRGLLEHECITVEFGACSPNPHIKPFTITASSAERQRKQLLNDDLQHACLYPTPSVLANAVDPTAYHDRPFTLRLMLGEGQLDHHAFDLSVLEFYRNDPRYYYEVDDIRGSISVRDAFFNSSAMRESDQVVLQTFGFGYDEEFERAVVVFSRYLHDLSPEHQQIWNAKRLTGDYSLHPDYYRNSILGEWGTKLSLFEAFLLELKVINEMCGAIGKPPLFRSHFEARSKGFCFLLRPTTKELNDFVLLLDQMLSDNINKDFFRGDIALEIDATRTDGKIEVRPKGTIQLLEEWFARKYRFVDDTLFRDAVATFRKVRKLRQNPAHKIEDSTFEQSIFDEQRALARTAYEAVRLLRLILANHPAAKTVKVMPELYRGDIWDR